MKNPGWTSLIAAAAFFGAAPPAPAQEMTLLFATTLPAQHVAVTDFLAPWAEKVNAAGKGIVKIDVRNGATIANPGNFYGRVMDDVVQIGWGNLNPIAGKFVQSGVIQLPFEFEKAEHGSVAFWRLYKQGLLNSDFDETVPLVLTAFPQSSIMLARPPASLDNLNGLKIGVGSKITSDIVQRLGATPISINVGEMYEMLQRGNINGLIMTFTAVPPFKLHEVTSYYVDTEMASASGAILMSRKKYNSLPANVRKILDDHSGEGPTRDFGKFWDRIQDAGRNMVANMPRHEIVKLKPEQEARWRRDVLPVVQDWARNTPNGEKTLAAFRSLLAEAKAGK